MIKQFCLTHGWAPTGTTTPGQSWPGNKSNKEAKVPELETHHQMQFSIITRTFIGGGLLPLQRYRSKSSGIGDSPSNAV